MKITYAPGAEKRLTIDGTIHTNGQDTGELFLVGTNRIGPGVKFDLRPDSRITLEDCDLENVTISAWDKCTAYLRKVTAKDFMPNPEDRHIITALNTRATMTIHNAEIHRSGTETSCHLVGLRSISGTRTNNKFLVRLFGVRIRGPFNLTANGDLVDTVFVTNSAAEREIKILDENIR